MKKLVVFILIVASANIFGQIGHGGEPLSSSTQLKTTVPTFTTPILDVTPYKNEDAITDEFKDIPPRFGVEQQVNINLNNSGLWENLPNGDKVWRVNIKSPNALSINLNFDVFYLPNGATFFVYNKNQTLGAFNHTNNKATGEFSTAPIKGENITLEYYEPATVSGKGTIQLKSVVHGYRDFWKQLKAFGSSGSCNVNAICDTTFWNNEIRSSVMLLTAGNTRFCSGALIANVPKDGTPFILTADHCGASSNNIFMFNYQSPNCSTNIDGPTTNTVSGCILRASDSPSDFSLVELSSTPPAGYNVFYSGWSNINTPASSATGIHHPRGDIKKISHDIDPLIESGYYSAGNDHWEVLDWNSGTTEGGSSGSPLYDQNHRIVGQLHGGDAACGNDAFDYYGKFSVSWDTDASISKQLKHWLDPQGTGVDVLDGYDPNGSQFVTDAVLLNISGIQPFLCGDSITPKIIVRNHGNSNLTTLDVNYELDGGGVTSVNWTGNLPSYGIDSIVLPTTYVGSGNHTFRAFCSNPNSTNDNNTLNDTNTVTFNSNANPTFATMHLIVDDYGSETSWIIRDASGAIYTEGGGYPDNNNGMLFTESLCLYDSCFTFVLKDAYNDGFCCSFGSGEFYLVDNWGDTIYSNTTFNSDSLVIPFCLNSTTSIDEMTVNDVNIYPNPTSGMVIIESGVSSTYQLNIYNAVGQIIFKAQNLVDRKKQIDLSGYTKGIYIIQVQTEKETITKRLILR